MAEEYIGFGSNSAIQNTIKIIYGNVAIPKVPVEEYLAMNNVSIFNKFASLRSSAFGKIQDDPSYINSGLYSFYAQAVYYLLMRVWFYEQAPENNLPNKAQIEKALSSLGIVIPHYDSDNNYLKDSILETVADSSQLWAHIQTTGKNAFRLDETSDIELKGKDGLTSSPVNEKVNVDFELPNFIGHEIRPGRFVLLDEIVGFFHMKEKYKGGLTKILMGLDPATQDTSQVIHKFSSDLLSQNDINDFLNPFYVPMDPNYSQLLQSMIVPLLQAENEGFVELEELVNQSMEIIRHVFKRGNIVFPQSLANHANKNYAENAWAHEEYHKHWDRIREVNPEEIEQLESLYEAMLTFGESITSDSSLSQLEEITGTRRVAANLTDSLLKIVPYDDFTAEEFWVQIADDINIEPKIFLNIVFDEAKRRDSQLFSRIEGALNIVKLHYRAAKDEARKDMNSFTRLITDTAIEGDSVKNEPASSPVGVKDLVGGSFKQKYLKHIRKIVNSKNGLEEKTTLYLASGADISTAIMSTGARRLYFVDELPFDIIDVSSISEGQWRRMEETAQMMGLKSFERSESQMVNFYLKQKQQHSLASTYVYAGGVRPFLMSELENLGAKLIQVKQRESQENIYDIYFDLNSKQYHLTFISNVDARNIETYAPHLESPVDIVLVKAGQTYMPYVAEPSPLVPERLILDYVKPGGYVILDSLKAIQLTNAVRNQFKRISDTMLIRLLEKAHNFGYPAQSHGASDDGVIILRKEGEELVRSTASSPVQNSNKAVFESSLLKETDIQNLGSSRPLMEAQFYPNNEPGNFTALLNITQLNYIGPMAREFIINAFDGSVPFLSTDPVQVAVSYFLKDDDIEFGENIVKIDVEQTSSAEGTWQKT